MNLWEEIRVTETPGKHGGDFFYARIIHSHFDDVENLKSEGFSLATICNFLKKKGILPTNSDPHSFRRAFRREISRRERVMKTSNERIVAEKKNLSCTKKEEETSASLNLPKRELKSPVISSQSKNSRAAPQINPDNTFKITAVDPDDLPYIN